MNNVKRETSNVKREMKNEIVQRLTFIIVSRLTFHVSRSKRRIMLKNRPKASNWRGLCFAIA